MRFKAGGRLSAAPGLGSGAQRAEEGATSSGSCEVCGVPGCPNPQSSAPLWEAAAPSSVFTAFTDSDLAAEGRICRHLGKNELGFEFYSTNNF